MVNVSVPFLIYNRNISWLLNLTFSTWQPSINQQLTENWGFHVFYKIQHATFILFNHLSSINNQSAVNICLSVYLFLYLSLRLWGGDDSPLPPPREIGGLTSPQPTPGVLQSHYSEGFWPGTGHLWPPTGWSRWKEWRCTQKRILPQFQGAREN